MRCHLPAELAVFAVLLKGVPKPWGLHCELGVPMGDFPVVTSMVTLAVRYFGALGHGMVEEAMGNTAPHTLKRRLGTWYICSLLGLADLFCAHSQRSPWALCQLQVPRVVLGHQTALIFCNSFQSCCLVEIRSVQQQTRLWRALRSPSHSLTFFIQVLMAFFRFYINLFSCFTPWSLPHAFIKCYRTEVHLFCCLICSFFFVGFVFLWFAWIFSLQSALRLFHTTRGPVSIAAPLDLAQCISQIWFLISFSGPFPWARAGL